MAESKAEQIAAKLLAERFQHSGPAVDTLTDPIAETPMIVTLDQLEPYDLDPRVTRNPLYEQLKASIRERHLDTPPPITRRPGAARFMIRNGGNTRLRILRELWAETRDENFYRICCLFRPWSTRGEIVVLTGHLAENELRGALSFIERAMGVQKAKELYQAEAAESLTQAELAKKLTADGYPITQSQISRMQDTVEHLLPAIPTVLYAGLGRPQIERLRNLRKASSRAWERCSENAEGLPDFPTLFRDVLAQFDHAPGEFDVQRVRDELLGQMAQILRQDYDELALQLFDAESWVKTMLHHVPSELAPTLPVVTVDQPIRETERSELARPSAARSPPQTPHDRAAQPARRSQPEAPVPSSLDVPPIHAEPNSALLTDAPSPSSKVGTVGQRIPIDEAASMRAELAQLAMNFAASIGAADGVEAVDDGLGFACLAVTQHDSDSAEASSASIAALNLLEALSAPARGIAPRQIGTVDLSQCIAPLLLGTLDAPPKVSDAGLKSLIALISAARKFQAIAADILP